MTFGSGPIKVVEKLWGREEWFANTPLYCLKRLYLEPNSSCSLHYHNQKDETFVIEEGQCYMEIEGETRRMEHGDWCLIPPNTKHKFWKHGVVTCVILEVSTHHDDSDVVRLEPSRKLAP